MRMIRPVRAVALFEGAKGVLALLAGISGLSLVRHGHRQFAEPLAGLFHYDLAHRLLRFISDAAAHLTGARVALLAILTGAYGLMHFVEAYGLWQGRRWAQWLAAFSGGVYIPFEVYALLKGAGWLSLLALFANVLIVVLMVNSLPREHPVDPANGS